MNVAKAQLGTKRLCPNCGTRYYDLERKPIVCPKCGAPFEPTVKARPQTAAAVADVEEEVEVEAEAELVPLEDADEEVAATGAVGAVTDEDEIEEEETDETFLEEDDEDGDDVSTIIGDVDDEEP